MYGAIIGDIIGSRFEFNPIKSKEFELFPGVSTHKTKGFDRETCWLTDDSLLTCAVAKAIMNNPKDLEEETVRQMQYFGNKYPLSYGQMFREWLEMEEPKPYNSFGNGAAMRISPVGWSASSEDEVKEMSYHITTVTHNHPEGIKGAEATAMCVYLARKNATKDDIKKYIDENYYNMNFNLDDLRPIYYFDETCQGTVPHSIMCFLEADSFEDTIRNAISLGGDADTMAAIAGSIAEPYYGIDYKFVEQANKYLPNELYFIVDDFRKRYII